MKNIKVNKYPDGSSYVEISNYTDMVLNENIFRVNNYEDLWHLRQFVDVYKHNINARPNIVIPNLIDAQADRRFKSDQSFGLKLVCEFLNSMDARFTIFHPHNQEVVEALMDNVMIMDNSAFIDGLFSRFDLGVYRPDDTFKSWTSDNLILMATYAGGFKPLMKLCDKLNWQGETYSGSKSRRFENGESIITHHIDRQDFGGKDIMLIDDLGIYGGTFKGISKMLKERNCGKLYLALSHMTVQNLGSDPVTNYFEKVFTTNSKFDQYFYAGAKNLAVPKNLEITKLF